MASGKIWNVAVVFNFKLFTRSVELYSRQENTGLLYIGNWAGKRNNFFTTFRSYSWSFIISVIFCSQQESSMANCRVKTGRFGSICLLLALWVIVLTQLVNSYDNCRTVRPIQGYCLTEEYSYQIIHGISLGTCIVHCEGSAKCSSISYQSEPNVCRLNNVTRNLSFSDFIQDEMCTYLENVLRPSSCFTHVCKSCACWCDRVQEDGDCEGRLSLFVFIITPK